MSFKKSNLEFIKMLEQSMSAGDFNSARKLAMEALKYHPQSRQLQQYARMLAPPEVTRGDFVLDPSMRANINWLKANHADYRGKWIALESGHLLGTDDSLKALTRQINLSENIMVTKVY